MPNPPPNLIEIFTRRLSNLKSVWPIMTVLVFIFLAMNIWGVYHKSLTVDERAHFEFGERILTGKLETAHMQQMPVSAFNVLPVCLLEKRKITLSEKGKVFFSRIPTVLASLVCAFFVFLWAKRLYGSRAGLFSLSLYMFCPTVLAHSRFIISAHPEMGDFR